MKRSTPLRRTAPLARRTPLPARSRRRPPRRDTGPTARTRLAVYARDGWACVVCAASVLAGAVNLQHRRARAMGGSTAPDTNTAPNLLTVCGLGSLSDCHGYIETHPIVALAHGWRIRQGDDPAAEPVLIRDRWVLLTHDGRYEPVEGAA